MRWSSRHLLPLAASLALVAGCDDAAGPTAAPAPDLDVFVPELAATTHTPGQLPTGDAAASAPDDAPAEFSEAPAILTSRLDVGFATTHAYAMAMMEFFGNRGEQTVNLELRYNGTPIANRSAQGFIREWLPGRYRLDTQVTAMVNDACGHTADGWSNHRAWHEYGSWTWGEDSQQNGGGAAQPECTPVPEQRREGRNDEEDTDWYICY